MHQARLEVQVLGFREAGSLASACRLSGGGVSVECVGLRSGIWGLGRWVWVLVLGSAPVWGETQAKSKQNTQIKSNAIQIKTNDSIKPNDSIRPKPKNPVRPRTHSNQIEEASSKGGPGAPAEAFARGGSVARPATCLRFRIEGLGCGPHQKLR